MDQLVLDTETLTLLRVLKEKYCNAESAIKTVEYASPAQKTTPKEGELIGGIDIPAVNQLRYAGKHLAEAMCSEDPTIRLEQIRKATNHCERALFDAAELGLLYELEKLKRFRDEFKNVKIKDYCSSYEEICQFAQTVNIFMADNVRDDKFIHADTCLAHFKTLQENNAKVDAVRPEIAASKRAQIHGFILKIVTAICAVIGVFWIGFQFLKAENIIHSTPDTPALAAPTKVSSP